MALVLADIVNLENLEKMIDEGYISRRESGDGRAVLNYTAAAAFDDVWNNETLNCRGLVYNTTVANNPILGKPFPKFFTLEQHEAKGLWMPTGPFIINEKMDGSLIVAYKWNGGIGLNTRGSFDSEQAIAADKWLYETFPTFEINQFETWLFEWVGPSNRIVVTYPDNELVLLDIISNFTGKSILKTKLETDHVENEPIYNGFKRAPRHKVDSWENLKQFEESNKEGFVILFPSHVTKVPDTRIKVKFDEYTQLHRVLTGVSEKHIWEYMSKWDWETRTKLVEVAPDEFYQWIIDTEIRYTEMVTELEGKLRGEFLYILRELGIDWLTYDKNDKDVRKMFAIRIAGEEYRSMLWRLWDEDEDGLNNAMWQSVKPKNQKPYFQSNDEES